MCVARGWVGAGARVTKLNPKLTKLNPKLNGSEPEQELDALVSMPPTLITYHLSLITHLSLTYHLSLITGDGPEPEQE